MIDFAPPTTAEERLVARALTIGRRTALGVLGDREAAADIAQDVALTALEQAKRLRDPEALDAWLHRVAVRRALREAKRSRSRRDAEQRAHRVPAVDVLDPVLDLLDGLPARQRAALTLRYVARPSRHRDRQGARLPHRHRALAALARPRSPPRGPGTMNELRERFAPLREETPTDEEIAAVLAARRSPRRRGRVAFALVTATAAAAVAIAALPGARGLAAHARRHAARRGRGRRRAARAARLHGLPLHRGARALPLGVAEQHAAPGGRAARRELGRPRAGRATSSRTRARPSPAIRSASSSTPTSATSSTATARCWTSTSARCPPSRARCCRRWTANFRAQNSAPGLPTPDQARYDITRSVLLLLGTANTTPSLRAALWGVLALTPGLNAAPEARDPLGRAGEAVLVPAQAERGLHRGGVHGDLRPEDQRTALVVARRQRAWGRPIRRTRSSAPRTCARSVTARAERRELRAPRRRIGM